MEGLDYHCLDRLPAPLHPYARRSGQGALLDSTHLQPVVHHGSEGNVQDSASAAKPHRSGLRMDVEALLAHSSPRPRPARLDPEQLSNLPRLPQLSSPTKLSAAQNPAHITQSCPSERTVTLPASGGVEMNRDGAPGLTSPARDRHTPKGMSWQPPPLQASAGGVGAKSPDSKQGSY